MLKKAEYVFLTIMLFTFLSVSTTLAKNDKAKHENNAQQKSENALGYKGNASHKPEKPERWAVRSERQVLYGKALFF